MVEDETEFGTPADTGDDSNAKPKRVKGKVVNGTLKVSNSAKPEGKVIYTPTIVTPEYLAEECWDRKSSSVPSYALRVFKDYPKYGLKAGDVTMTLPDKDGKPLPITQIKGTNIFGEKVTYKPVDDAILRKHAVMVPEAPMMTTFDEAFQQGLELAMKIYDCRESDLDKMKLMVYCSYATWFLDKFQKDFDQTTGMFAELDIAGAGVFAPILAARGASGGGKNRLLNALRFLSYRPIWNTHTSRVASLYRPFDTWKGTLFIDEANFTSDEAAEITQYLACRAQDTPYIRVGSDDPNRNDVFRSFGTTGVTQRRGWDDDALEDRSIVFPVTKTHKKVSVVEKREWLQEAWEIQNKLLYLRMKFWEQVHVDPDWHMEGMTNHRLTAAMLIVHALEPFAPGVIKNFVETVKHEDALRRSIKADSMDGLIINAMWDSLKKGAVGMRQGVLYVGKEEDPSVSEYVPMGATDIVQEIGQHLARTNIRKTIDDLNLVDKARLESLPYKIVVGKHKPVHPIWFDPEVLNTFLQDFVVDYKDNELLGIIPVATMRQLKITMEGENKPEASKSDETPKNDGTPAAS